MNSRKITLKQYRDNIIDRAKMRIENLDDLSENTLQKELKYFCGFILSKEC